MMMKKTTTSMERVRRGRDPMRAPTIWPLAPEQTSEMKLTRALRPITCISLLLVLTSALFVCQSAFCFYIDSKQSPRTTEWNYNDQLVWHNISRECRGRIQSPIDIKQRNVIISHNLRLNFYNYDKPIRFKLTNAHHTIKMNPLGSAYARELEKSLPVDGSAQGLDLSNTSLIHEIMTAVDYEQQPAATDQAQAPASNRAAGGRPQTPDQSNGRPGHRLQTGRNQANAVERDQPSGGGLFGFHLTKEKIPIYEGAPTIKLDWFDDDNNEFKLRDIHFHWAERRDNGSEHAIDGRRAAMEMHLVHIKHGLDKSSIGFTSDSVAVIAILIESHRKSNLDFNPIVNELARINSSERAQEVEYKSLYDLLPNNLQAFYTYSGSLTTPPCYQVVNWIVMAERLNMNAKQIEMFRNLYSPPAAGHQEHASEEYPTGPHLIMPNVRSLQALNNRTIMASFTRQGSRLESVTIPYNSASSTQTYQFISLILIQILLAIQLANSNQSMNFQTIRP